MNLRHTREPVRRDKYEKSKNGFKRIYGYVQTRGIFQPK